MADAPKYRTEVRIEAAIAADECSLRHAEKTLQEAAGGISGLQASVKPGSVVITLVAVSATAGLVALAVAQGFGAGLGKVAGERLLSVFGATFSRWRRAPQGQQPLGDVSVGTEPSMGRIQARGWPQLPALSASEQQVVINTGQVVAKVLRGMSSEAQLTVSVTVQELTASGTTYEVTARVSSPGPILLQPWPTDD